MRVWKAVERAKHAATPRKYVLHTTTSAAVAARYRAGISVRTKAARLVKTRAPKMWDQMLTVSSVPGDAVRVMPDEIWGRGAAL